MKRLLLVLVCLAIQCQSLVYATGTALPCPMQEHTRFSHCDMDSKQASTACKTCCKHPVNCESSANLAVNPFKTLLPLGAARNLLVAHVESAPRNTLLRDVWRPPLLA
ncbi:hypothetical protein [Limnobacter litoralis]|uniref:hypothetical protein n=1 Tax=Limnobacter litoralis TaxID=481366 RepID=UPI0024E16210|nr:hypothetical protein [Limnobacter litoralis]